MDNKRRIPILLIALGAIAAAILYLEFQKAVPGGFIASDVQIDTTEDRVQNKAREYAAAKDITTPDGFINVDDISVQELIGEKVILIDFWTYSCINCQRTTPYLNAWYEEYADQGLEIIGIHTPEFEFEKEYENVLAAVERLGIEFPVVLDNDYSTWRAYNNRYWPRKYLIDIDGFIVYDHIGEGAYDETEEWIRRLLEERATVLEENLALDDMVEADSVPVDFSQVNSPEVYFGAFRNDLGNGTSREVGEQVFEYPNDAKDNTLYFDGTWLVEEEFVRNSEPGAGSFRYIYDAKNVHMVASGDATLSIKIGGQEVNRVTISGDQLYTLIEGDSYGQNVLEVEVVEGTVDVYTFTFG